MKRWWRCEQSTYETSHRKMEKPGGWRSWKAYREQREGLSARGCVRRCRQARARHGSVFVSLCLLIALRGGQRDQSCLESVVLLLHNAHCAGWEPHSV